MIPDSKKFWDVIGLYLNPPERALVLCCDEKSQCQALERTQTALPLGPRKVRTGTHDYVRHGTITLFAALSYLDSKIFRQTAPQHTHKEWLAFLKKLDRETPADLSLHLVIDNYATHRQPLVMEWINSRNKRQKHQGIDRLNRGVFAGPRPFAKTLRLEGRRAGHLGKNPARTCGHRKVQ